MTSNNLRTASCACGQLSATCRGEPVRVSICHCLECQKRTGSVFSANARFPREAVTVSGPSSLFRRKADSGNNLSFHFCPQCGTTVWWELEAFPDVIAVAVGAFADPEFPAPAISVYEERHHRWVDPARLPVSEHID
jgi:hypothetical protein